MCSLFRQNLCSKPFPDAYGKFINSRNARDKRNARASARRSKIELFSYTLVRNCFHPVRNTKARLSRRTGFRCAAADSPRSEFVCAQEALRERVCYKRPRFGLWTKIAFSVKLRERKIDR